MTVRTLAQLSAELGGVVHGDSHTQVHGITHDSRRAAAGILFAAVPGLHSDGRPYVQEAQAAGAPAAMIEPPALPLNLPQVLVPSVREALPRAARYLYGAPPSTAPVIGITGTNGKTTTAYLVDALLRAAGYQPALVGSIEGRFGKLAHDAANTTPEATDLHVFWAQAEAEGADALVMETSSHGLLLHRSDAVGFNIAVFTNLTRDHLDYHPDAIAYRGAKTRLFGMLPRRGAAVLCADDPQWEHFARATQARVITYGLAESAHVRAGHVEIDADGIRFEVVTKHNTFAVTSTLFGRFNLHNLLAAAAVGYALKLEPDAIASGLRDVHSIPGRAERIDCGQPFVVLNDFAHTPDALARILSAAKELTAGKLTVVFGCGGDRDPGKRPQMGQVAVSTADRVVVTSDNPRTEDPQQIIDQIVEPLEKSAKLMVEPDRHTAIRTALQGLTAGDTLIVAGKGHEHYQIVGTKKHKFDDAEVLRQELSQIGFAG